ncbi:MAG: hypothetical protein ACPGJV_06935 [Bacteriovoracaceae bacterium]
MLRRFLVLLIFSSLNNLWMAHASTSTATAKKEKPKAYSAAMSIDRGFPVKKEASYSTDVAFDFTYKLNDKQKLKALQYAIFPSEVEAGEDKVQATDTYLFHYYTFNKNFTYRSTMTLPFSDASKDNGRITRYEGRLYMGTSLGKDKEVRLTFIPLAAYYFNEFKFSPDSQRKNKRYGIGGIFAASYSATDKLSFGASYVLRLDWEERSEKDVSDNNQTAGSYVVDLYSSYSISKNMGVRVGYQKSEAQRQGTEVEYLFFRPEAASYYVGLDLSLCF